MANGQVTDDTRLRAAIPTIKELQAKKAAVVLMAHFGRPKGKVVPEMSLKPVIAPLAALLGTQVKFSDDLDQPHQVTENLKASDVLLLENLRFKAGEEANDPKFVDVLAQCGDIWVNDAFSAAHRAHASTEGLATSCRPMPAAPCRPNSTRSARRWKRRPSRSSRSSAAPRSRPRSTFWKIS